MQRRTDPSRSVPINATSHPDSKASIINAKLTSALREANETDSPTARVELSGIDVDLMTAVIVTYTTRKEAQDKAEKFVNTGQFLFREEVLAEFETRATERESAVLALNTAWEKAGGKPRPGFLARKALFEKK